MQVAEELGVKLNPLYTVTQKLVDEGKLQKQGRQLFPADPRHGRPTPKRDQLRQGA
jgi:hypothetical protein